MKNNIIISFLTITLLLGWNISFAQNTISNLDINIVPRQEMYEWCGRNDCHGCYYEGITYVANDLGDRTLWVIMHEACHHLQRNISDYRGEIEEGECTMFASYMTQGGYETDDDKELKIINKVKLLIRSYWR